MSDKASILDRIDVRYLVDLSFEFDRGTNDFAVATARISITCGTYAGEPTRRDLADLVAARGVQPEDLDVTGRLGRTNEHFSAIIAERGVDEKEVIRATLAEILLDEKCIAATL